MACGTAVIDLDIIKTPCFKGEIDILPFMLVETDTLSGRFSSVNGTACPVTGIGIKTGLQPL